MASSPSVAEHVRRDYFRVIARWEGVVLSVDSETFVVRLTDDSGRQPEVQAEIHLDEVAEADRDLLRANGLFYWTIGFRETKTGDRIRESRIRFRRLPGWRPEELAEADRWADETRDMFGW
jgi:hypothetical protein